MQFLASEVYKAIILGTPNVGKSSLIQAHDDEAVQVTSKEAERLIGVLSLKYFETSTTQDRVF